MWPRSLLIMTDTCNPFAGTHMPNGAQTRVGPTDSGLLVSKATLCLHADAVCPSVLPTPNTAAGPGSWKGPGDHPLSPLRDPWEEA